MICATCGATDSCSHLKNDTKARSSSDLNLIRAQAQPVQPIPAPQAPTAAAVPPRSNEDVSVSQRFKK